jgi:NAD(P)-dependent dehydrogenase (short-subunit alcohol dehydrogenase family)
MAPSTADGPQRVAVVTGASRGLGLACARRLAADGVAIALVGRDADTLSAAADGLRADGAQAIGVVADVRHRDACADAVSTAVGEFGRLDVLVNAAGVFPRRPLLDMTADDWHHVLDINVLGTYFMMIEAIPHMRAVGGGRIVNVSSIDGVKAHPPNAHYAASKAAVISITRSVALEVAPEGIVVNAVAPGPLATDTAKATDWYAPMVAGLPTRHPIEPTEIAELVAFLASPGNISIVGENIVVSGGAVIV